MIAGWLSSRASKEGLHGGARPGFELLFYDEGTPRNQDQLNGMRQTLRNAYLEEDYVQARVNDHAYPTTEDVYQSEAFSIYYRVRRGDFGEAIGEFLINEVPHLQCFLPRRNFAHKENNDLPARGFDYLGFQFSEVHGQDVLVIGEAKYRDRAVSRIYLSGQIALSEYSREREIKELGKAALHLHREGDVEARERLARFNEGFSGPPFQRRHVLIVVHDSTTSVARAIQRIPARTRLDAFTVIDVSIPRINELVDQAYAR